MEGKSDYTARDCGCALRRWVLNLGSHYLCLFVNASHPTSRAVATPAQRASCWSEISNGAITACRFFSLINQKPSKRIGYARTVKTAYSFHPRRTGALFMIQTAPI